MCNLRCKSCISNLTFYMSHGFLSSQAQKANLLHVNCKPTYKDVESCIFWTATESLYWNYVWRKASQITYARLWTSDTHDFYLKPKNRKSRVRGGSPILFSMYVIILMKHNHLLSHARHGPWHPGGNLTIVTHSTTQSACLSCSRQAAGS